MKNRNKSLLVICKMCHKPRFEHSKTQWSSHRNLLIHLLSINKK